VEQLWSRAVATGGNQSQLCDPFTRLKRADQQPLATRGNLPSFDGKEGVDGSSPSEGSAKAPEIGGSAVGILAASGIMNRA
jgi:hypothetical protein